MLEHLSRASGVLIGVATFLGLSVAWSDERPIDLAVKQVQGSAPDGWGFFCEESATPCGDVWQLVDGVLICKGTPKGYIYTLEKQTDFVLRLQWRWPAGKKPGRGGVLIRTTGKHKIWPKSLEAQINVPQAGEFWGLDGFSLSGPTERTTNLTHEQFGKLTNVKRKTADVERPAGEWNQYEIIAKGPVVTLKINGQVVNTATRCEVEPGWICLTAEGDEIHFRKIQLLSR